MGLRQLQHFVTLVEQGNFARAAAALHLSQPALSRSIQALETDCGSQLVDRAYGKARPTAAGLIVLERARRMLREGRELRRDLELLQDVAIGELRVGFGPFAAAFLMSPVLTALATAYPALRIDLEIADTPSLVRGLEAERLDLFVGESHSLAQTAQLRIERLPPVETAFYVRAGHPLAARAKVALADLAHYPVAGPRVPQRVSDSFRRLLAAQGVDPARELLTIHCDEMHAVRTLVLGSDTVGLLPRAVMRGTRAKALTMAPALDQKTAYGIVSLAGHTLSPAAEAFIARVHAVLGRSGASSASG
jgi:DNA-binding transcriptional LysR family regulator